MKLSALFPIVRSVPIAALARGFSETDTVKILGGNFLRVFRRVLDAAPSAASPDAGPAER
jgi:hypothetical protein